MQKIMINQQNQYRMNIAMQGLWGGYNSRGSIETRVYRSRVLERPVLGREFPGDSSRGLLKYGAIEVGVCKGLCQMEILWGIQHQGCTQRRVRSGREQGGRSGTYFRNLAPPSCTTLYIYIYIYLFLIYYTIDVCKAMNEQTSCARPWASPKTHVYRE